MAYSRIRPRRGTAYEWATINPVLESGEWGVEAPDTGIGTGFSKFKIGNGTDAWNDLAYAFDGTSAAAIDGGGVTEFHVIQLRSGSHQLWEDVNPILNKNEPGYDIDKNAIKIGDGVTPWKNLEYLNAGSLVDDDFDFGNEDNNDVIYSLDNLEEVEGRVEDLNYPDTVFELFNERPQPEPEPEPGPQPDPDPDISGEDEPEEPDPITDDDIDDNFDHPSIDLDGGDIGDEDDDEGEENEPTEDDENPSEDNID